MRRDQLELAVLVATSLIDKSEVLVIGSQAILASFDDHQLPERAIFSREVDIAPLEDDERESLAERIDAGAGEWSPFDARYGFYIQGVSVRTAYLPGGWAERVVRVYPTNQHDVVGLCLEPHDLCAAKLARSDQRDREYVEALIRAGLVSASTIRERVNLITDDRFVVAVRALAEGFLQHFI